jgi:hypothetical protein
MLRVEAAEPKIIWSAGQCKTFLAFASDHRLDAFYRLAA